MQSTRKLHTMPPGRIRTARFYLPVAMLLLSASWALAADATAGAATSVRPGEVGRGSLLLRGDDDSYSRAPELKTIVDIDVSGAIARTVVRQLFSNPGDGWQEGAYVFPLPDGAAVDTLRLQVGDRLIEGRIEERAKARAIYEQSREEGRKAALLEGERSNIFTTSLANIGPGESVAVEIRYQERLRFVDGEFRLRFPMVVGPRYIPGSPAPQAVTFTGEGWARPSDQVPDADRNSPPVRHPDGGPVNPVALTVRLAAGFPLAELSSHHHPVHVDARGESERTISLADGVVPADRDFELTWKPVPGSAPMAGLFRETDASGSYVLAMLMPPGQDAADAPQMPRDLTFVLDVSGSMAGASIQQAKAALLRALDTLGTSDRLNIIAFSDRYWPLFDSPRQATGAVLHKARAWIGSLEADGGTEMLPALQAALSGSAMPGRLHQVVFLTDGAVGNEVALFSLIRRQLGDARLFTVGIGSAPNSHFMTGAARAGRGTFTHIGNDDQVADRIDTLVAKLQAPAITGIAATSDGGNFAPAPARIPDLYAGEPVVIVARVDPAATSLAIQGTSASDRWSLVLPLEQASAGHGIAKLWARESIADLEQEKLTGDSAEAIDAEITSLALDYGLVTRLTSLVAVDVTPARPQGEPLDSRPLETNLPAGWQFEKVFGDEFRRIRESAPVRKAGLSPTAPVQTAASAENIDVSLPRTATTAQLQATMAALLLVLAGLFIWLDRRQAAR